MRIQCNVCGSEEATVLCCADEATLCGSCDLDVHAANKLASKHQRVPLSTSSSSSPMPNCDICQETVGYFFCLEDRALLCRKCDVAIHTVNNLVSGHQRFLLTGAKVGPEITTHPAPSSSSAPKKKTEESTDKISDVEPRSLPKNTAPETSTTQYSSKTIPHVQVNNMGGDQEFSSSKIPSSGTSFSQWQLDQFIELGDFSQTYNFEENGSSKAADDELKYVVPDTYWAVPEITSQPTPPSGLYCPKSYPDPSDSAVDVPDVISSPMQNFVHHHQSHIISSKRRRNY